MDPLVKHLIKARFVTRESSLECVFRTIVNTQIGIVNGVVRPPDLQGIDPRGRTGKRMGENHKGGAQE
jgi:hypothetical protein